MSGRARMLNREIDAGQHKIVHVGKLVDDPDNMRCCLDSSVFDFEKGLVLREAVAGYS